MSDPTTTSNTPVITTTILTIGDVAISTLQRLESNKLAISLLLLGELDGFVLIDLFTCRIALPRDDTFSSIWFNARCGSNITVFGRLRHPAFRRGVGFRSVRYILHEFCGNEE